MSPKFELHPTAYTPYFFENYLDAKTVASMTQHISDRIHWSYISCAVYVVTIHVIQYLMRNREPFKLRSLLIIWNVLLAVFSIFGTCRISHHLTTGILTKGVDGYFHCDYRGEDMLVKFWKMLFGVSKILELGDTGFIVLRKSKLSFLHWYHHVTVLLYSLPLAEHLSYSTHTNVGNWFAGVNFAVHSIMYTYYALRAMGFRVWRPVAMSITTVQILQMVGGLWAGFYVPWWKCGKSLTSYSMSCTIVMYTSYFLLFCNYFARAYLIKKKTKKIE